MRFKATDNVELLKKNLHEVGDITDDLVKLCYHKYIAPVYQKTLPKKRNRRWIYQQQYRHTQRDLLKLKYILNGYSAKGIKEGFVYAIINPNFPGYVKIGSAIDVIDRLNQYQTYSPLRNYELVRYAFVPDRVHYERLLHKKFSVDGEWASSSIEEVDKAIKDISIKFTPV